MKGDLKNKKRTPSVNDLFSRGVMAIANTSEIWKLLDLGHWVSLGRDEIYLERGAGALCDRQPS